MTPTVRSPKSHEADAYFHQMSRTGATLPRSVGLPTRRRLGRLTTALLIGVVLGGTGLGMVHASADSTIGSPTTPWSIVGSPNPAGASETRLQGVSCPSTSFCVAVGYSYGAQPVIEDWEGGNWTLAANPNVSSGMQLQAISCTSVTFCMAVGTGAEEWNGTAWSVVTWSDDFPVPPYQPGHPSQPGPMVSVSCLSPTFCMGVTSTFPISAVDEWDGTTWSFVGALQTGEDSLGGVSCVSASFCMAVGDSTVYSYSVGNDTVQTLTEEWNGSNWSVITSPDTSPDTTWDNNDWDFLDGVSCASVSFCMATGVVWAEDGAYPTLMEEWDGSAWNLIPSPSPPGGQGEGLQSVSCPTSTFCMAVGNQPSGAANPSNNGAPQVQTLTEAWNGNTWSVLNSANTDPGEDNGLASVDCAASTFCVAAGGYDSSELSPYAYDTLIEQWDGAGLPPPPAGPAFVAPPTPSPGSNFSSATTFPVVAEDAADPDAITSLTETQEDGAPAGELSCSAGSVTSSPGGTAEIDCSVSPVDTVNSYWMVFSATADGITVNLLLTVGATAVPTGPQFLAPTPPSGTAFSPPNNSFTVDVYDPYGNPVTLTGTYTDSTTDTDPAIGPLSEVTCSSSDEVPPGLGYEADSIAVVGNPAEVECTVSPLDDSSYPILFTATSSYGPDTISSTETYSAGDGSYAPTADGFGFPNYSESGDPQSNGQERTIADMASDYPTSASTLGDMFLSHAPSAS